MRSAYEMLLLLYPPPFRAMFGREMALVFEQASGACRSRGLLAFAGFLCAEFAGLVAGAFSTWTDEYMLRSRRRLSIPFLVSLAAGAAFAALTQGCFVFHIGRHEFIRQEVAEAPVVVPDRVAVMLLAGGSLLFVSLFSMAFVWNMRIVGIRAGRLKPIWMPGRATHARTAKRVKTLHRNSGRQRP